jgi:DNA-binding response OmpR family regulator
MRAVIAVTDPQSLDDICAILSMCLPDLGLLLADSGSSCIQMVREQSPDLVIIDYHLPDLSGSKIIEEIRQITPSPIIVLSYLNDDANVVKAIECGADEFCTTPIKQLEFAAHIRALLRRGRVAKGRKVSTQPRADKKARSTVGLRESTKAKLDGIRAPGQCYDGFLCQLVELWEKTYSNIPLSRR